MMMRRENTRYTACSNMKLCDVNRTREKKQEVYLECTSNVCRNGVRKENKSASAAKNKCAFYGTNPRTWQLNTSNIK